jgi:hypothetical protein
MAKISEEDLTDDKIKKLLEGSGLHDYCNAK